MSGIHTDNWTEGKISSFFLWVLLKTKPVPERCFTEYVEIFAAVLHQTWTKFKSPRRLVNLSLYWGYHWYVFLFINVCKSEKIGVYLLHFVYLWPPWSTWWRALVLLELHSSAWQCCPLGMTRSWCVGLQSLAWISQLKPVIKIHEAEHNGKYSNGLQIIDEVTKCTIIQLTCL